MNSNVVYWDSRTTGMTEKTKGEDTAEGSEKPWLGICERLSKRALS